MKKIMYMEQISYDYGDGTKGLQEISLEIMQGEKLAVLGTNGSGKSTLFLCMNGVLKPTAGMLYLQGNAFRYDRKSLMEIRKQIGIVFQEPDTQLFCANVMQEIAFGAINLGYDKEKIKRVVQQSMEQMDIVHLANKPPHLLSYGQKKRVCVAAVLAMEPQMIIFDEPTSSLDPYHSQQMIEVMENLHQHGKTMVVSTHDLEFAYSWADRVAVLHEGKLLEVGAPKQIFINDQLLEKAQLVMPMVVRLQRKLVDWGMLGEQLPLADNLAQLEAYMKRATMEG